MVTHTLHFVFTLFGVSCRDNLEENAWEVKKLCNLLHFGAVLVPPILRHLAPTNARRVEPRMSAFAEM